MTTSVHLDQFVTENGHFFDPFSKSFPLSAYDLVCFHTKKYANSLQTLTFSKITNKTETTGVSLRKVAMTFKSGVSTNLSNTNSLLICRKVSFFVFTTPLLPIKSNAIYIFQFILNIRLYICPLKAL